MSILFCHCTVLLRENGTYRALQDAFLGVSGDLIDYIGTERPIVSYDEERDGGHRLFMPGLVNCHCHAPMVLLRGVGSGRNLQQWLTESVFPVEARLTDEDIAVGSRLAIMEMLAGGVTSYSDMYFNVREEIPAVAESGIKANIGRCVQGFDGMSQAEQDAQVSESVALFERYHNTEQGRIRMDFAMHAEYTCNQKLVQQYSELCFQHGGRMHIHLSETGKERNDSIERHGCSPTAWFEKMGTFRSPTAAAHCVTVSEADMSVMRVNGVSAIHNPSSNMKLGSGFAPLRRMLDLGINVTLGTDGAASNNNLNMWEELHLAALIHCGFHHEPTHFSMSELLDMATINGAKLQGREDTGVLEVGKKADIIALDLTKLHLNPQLDIPALLLYSAQASDVCMTMVDGRILYENGIFFTLDREKIMHDVTKSIERLYG